ncbi:MAG TPA: metalloregulator ArsR/SmtB family transcription factor [Bacteroidota bacterium]|jgi:DNA-binding transcriptional ArsR family regulator
MNTPEDYIVKVAKALSDKTRVKILQEIAKCGSVSCADAENLAGLSQPTVSHHLKVLANAGLVVTEKKGRHVNIKINKAVLNEFAELVALSGKK